ncbi:protein PSK SIMULATOR 1-like [Populus alba x Populus x berolinensis]|uniref:Protein PSK SIMULATOR 1-like n=1 Tax=Populus alba x Populus x berolinensis TaxID=444605 RepID=A0AAD6MA44_9ROSI|nr:protein PSK SIMULATOR 1-like [Populus alba x Populus x berolinensis]
MVAEAWIVKMGNQVSSNLKHALLLESSKKKSNHSHNHNHNHPRNKQDSKDKQIIGILSFEVANVLSKTVHLHRSLTDSEISKLKSEILKSEGVKNLVSTDESYLLQLALAEKLDDLNRVANVVSRLGKKCVEPALQGFEHVYGDIVGGVIDVKELGFLVKDMEGMVKKMERYVNATSNLYCELEVLNELEQATKKFQQNQHEESQRAFEQKLIWQRQDVRHLKEISLWNQTCDKVVELLARTVCTIYARISAVFGESVLQMKGLGAVEGVCSSPPMKDECWEVPGHIGDCHGSQRVSGPLRRAVSKRSSSLCQSGPIERAVVEKRDLKPRIASGKGGVDLLFRTEDIVFPCGTSPGRLFLDCLSLSSSASKFDDDDSCVVVDEDQRSQTSRCYSVGNGSVKIELPIPSGFSNRGVSFRGDQRQARRGGMNNARFGPKSRLMVYAPPSTVGGSALALHYANVIIVIEKLLRYPHLVGEEARDDLYQMLPTSLRMSLRTNLKSYVKHLAIYDAPLAHDWKETLDGILRWLAPLAHNMIRWQSERNFEEHQIVKRTNVLLLQTLYFADRGKTEAAICELLVGMNYICRYEHQQNALLDCASSFDFEDCMQWQLQCRASFVD